MRKRSHHLPVEFWYLWSGTLITRLGNLALLYLEISLVARYHFSASFAGFTLGLAGAGSAVGAVVGGVLADRLGRRGTLLVANLACAGFTLALAFPTKALLVAVLVAAYGFAAGATRPASSAMMIDVLAPSERAHGLNLNYWAMNIGFAGAATLSGALASQPRIWVFGIDALSTAAAAVLVFARVRATKPAVVAKEHHAEGLGTVLRDRTFIAFVLLGTGFWTVISCVGLMPITMLHRGLPPAAFGSVLAVNGVIIVAGQLFVPRLLRDRSRTAALALASALVAIGIGAIAVAPSVFALTITVTIWTFGEMLSVPGSSSLTAELSPTHLRGRYQGVASMTVTFSGFLAPVIGGLVIDHAGDAAIWVGCFALGMLVAIGHLITGPARERKATRMRALEVERPRAPALV